MQHELSDNLIMLAELPIKPERRDEFLAYTTANLSVSRGYPGNIQFDMLLDPEQPDMVRFYEVWTSAAAQQAYMAWRTQAGDLTVLLSFLAAEPRFTALRCVAA